jgi:hypothetical protein
VARVLMLQTAVNFPFRFRFRFRLPTFLFRPLTY